MTSDPGSGFWVPLCIKCVMKCEKCPCIGTERTQLCTLNTITCLIESSHDMTHHMTVFLHTETK